MRINLIYTMLATQAKLAKLHRPTDPRRFYDAHELTSCLGGRPTRHTARVMRQLGWASSLRQIRGTCARVWFAPAGWWWSTAAKHRLPNNQGAAT